MSNVARWIRERYLDKAVRARSWNSITFDMGDGRYESCVFTQPIHYLDDAKNWQEIENTLIVQPNGSYGYGGATAAVSLDGTVDAGDISFRTTRIGVLNPQNGAFTPINSFGTGTVVGNSLIQQAGVYTLVTQVSPTGIRQVLTIPSNPGVSANRYLALETVPTGFTLGTGSTVVNGRLFPAPKIRTTPFDTAAQRLVANGRIYTGIPSSVLNGAKYPLVLDPDYYTNTTDAFITGASLTWATARSTAWGYDTTSTYLRVGLQWISSYYYINRIAIKYDTSGIPDGATITGVTMSIKASSTNWTTTSSIYIVKYNWSASDPITSLSIAETVYDGILAATLDAAWGTNSQITAGVYRTSSALDTSWINKTGWTYYGLLEYEHDRLNSSYAGFQACDPYSYDWGTPGDHPYLTVTYTEGTILWGAAALSASATATAVGVITRPVAASAALSANAQASTWATLGGNDQDVHAFSSQGIATVSPTAFIAGIQWAAAALTSTATVAALGGIPRLAAAALSSAATCTSIPWVDRYVAATLSGAATTVAVGGFAWQGAAVLSAAATCTATPWHVIAISSAVSGAATCTAQPTFPISIAATLAGAATVDTKAHLIFQVQSALSASATASANGYVSGVQWAAAALDASATCASAAQIDRWAIAPLSAAATTQALGGFTWQGAAVLDAAATCSATGTLANILWAATALDAAATCTSICTLVVPIACAIAGAAQVDTWATLGGNDQDVHAFSSQGVATASATGYVGGALMASATLDAAASATAIGGFTLEVAVALSAVAATQSLGGFTWQGIVTLSSTAACTASPLRVIFATSVLSAAATSVSTSILVIPIAASTTSIATQAAIGNSILKGIAAVTGAATASATGYTQGGAVLWGAAALSGAAACSPTVTHVIPIAIALNAAGSCVAQPTFPVSITVTLNGICTATTVGHIILAGGTQHTSACTIEAVGGLRIAASSSLSSIASLYPLAKCIYAGSSILSSVATATATGSLLAEILASASLVAAATATATGKRYILAHTHLQAAAYISNTMAVPIAATLNATASCASNATGIWLISASMDGVATCIAFIGQRASLAAAATCIAEPSVIRRVAIHLISSATLVNQATVVRRIAANISGSAVILAFCQRATHISTSLISIATTQSKGKWIGGGKADISGIASVAIYHSLVIRYVACSSLADAHVVSWGLLRGEARAELGAAAISQSNGKLTAKGMGTLTSGATVQSQSIETLKAVATLDNIANIISQPIKWAWAKSTLDSMATSPSIGYICGWASIGLQSQAYLYSESGMQMVGHGIIPGVATLVPILTHLGYVFNPSPMQVDAEKDHRVSIIGYNTVDMGNSEERKVVLDESISDVDVGSGYDGAKLP